MIKNRRRLAMLSTELTVGISLAVVAAVVAAGLFSDNLSNLVSNSKLSNVFNGGKTKTQYSALDRSYSNSQVEVQIMGEQGLSMLRKRANNKAIELIEESFSQSNTNADSIAYLAKSLEALTGEPNICVYMKADSDKHCDKIGGYNYDININGSMLTLRKIDGAGTVVLTLKDQVSSILDSAIVPKNSEGYSTFSSTEKYDFINDLTQKLKSYLRSDVFLTRVITTVKSSTNVAVSNSSRTGNSNSGHKDNTGAIVAIVAVVAIILCFL